MVGNIYKSQKEELLIRSISALLIVPVVIGILFLGFPYFNILIFLACLILLREYFYLCNKSPFWMVLGAVYIIPPCFALTHLRALEIIGFETVLFLFITVWAADIGAFAFGRLLKGKKLAPKISPNKTWSGFFGGVICSLIIGVILAFIFRKNNIGTYALISFTIGVISQLGDLLESWVKRVFNKKDTGTLIPGHGGLLDRVDGLLPASIIMWGSNFYFSKKSLFLWN